MIGLHLMIALRLRNNYYSLSVCLSLSLSILMDKTLSYAYIHMCNGLLTYHLSTNILFSTVSLKCTFLFLFFIIFSHSPSQ